MINALFLKAPDERRQVSCISLVLRLYSGLANLGAESALSFPSWGLLGPPHCPAAWLASLELFTDRVGSRWRCVSPCPWKNARNVPEAEPLHQRKPNTGARNIKRWKPCCFGGSRGRSPEIFCHAIECSLGQGRYCPYFPDEYSETPRGVLHCPQKFRWKGQEEDHTVRCPWLR